MLRVNFVTMSQSMRRMQSSTLTPTILGCTPCVKDAAETLLIREQPFETASNVEADAARRMGDGNELVVSVNWDGAQAYVKAIPIAWTSETTQTDFGC